MYGNTKLNVNPADAPENVVLNFDSWNGGMPGWWIRTDALGRVVESVPAALASSIRWRDPSRRLGQGARIEMSVEACLFVLVAWAEDSTVERGLMSGQLVIKADRASFPPRALAILAEHAPVVLAALRREWPASETAAAE